jgi:fused signal recognition particle receptor
MDEIKKVRKTIDKAMAGAPHETLLVLDATTGQNALTQAQMFKDAVDLTGIILTKLDGTAKGGIVLGICDELKLPVRFIGLGERAEDLREFSPVDFAYALFGDEEETSASS